MEGHVKYSSLLVLSMLFWLLYASGFQELTPVLPAIRIPVPQSNHISVGIPLSQILVLLFVLADILIFYYLYSMKGTLRFTHNLVFLMSSFMTVSGMSMHTVAVIVEKEIAKDNPISPLVAVLHQYVSHSTAMIGFYSTIGIIVWKEYNSVIASFEGKKDSKSSLKKNIILPPLWGLCYQWVVPVVLGAFLAVYSISTITEMTAVPFFFFIFFLVFKIYRRLQSYGARQIFNEATTLGFFFVLSATTLLLLFLFYAQDLYGFID